jgi:hypothetical protein
MIAALGVLALATIHVVTFMIFANATMAILWCLVVVLASLVGVVMVLRSLAMAASRHWTIWCTHVVALAILASVFCFYWFGGRLLDLLYYRTSLMLALTGGREELQSWATDVLAQPRGPREHEGAPYVVERKRWSRQVRWLRPSRVSIWPIFKNGQEGLVLDYDVPHEVCALVIGPPGAVPAEDSGTARGWLRIADGLYFWFS